MTTILRAWAEAALDIFFPPACVGCGVLGTAPLCPACEALSEPAAPLRIDGVDEAVAIWRYGEPIDRALHRLKYRDAPHIARPLAEALRVVCAPLTFDLVVPIPLAAARLRHRRFNQARELARRLAPVDVDALIRTRETMSQVGRSFAERHRNLRDAFSADPARICGRSVLVVDDVVTTGATVTEAARTLYAAGAKSVVVATVAAVSDDRCSDGVDQSRQVVGSSPYERGNEFVA
ncbi:MAG: phosphoribosyltransferase family protein [Myxococcota bacterium]